MQRELDIVGSHGSLCGELVLLSPCTVFTFDDGYRSVYDHACPLLREHGFKGTLFVVTDYCGSDNNWPGQRTGFRDCL